MTSDVSISRATDPLTSMFPVISLIFHVTFYDICMSHGDPPRLFLCHDDAISLMLISGYHCLSSCRRRFPLRPLVSRATCLAGYRYAQFSTRFVSFPSLTRLDVILVFYFYGSYASLYLYLTDLYIYWVGDGTIPIFNLLCNHPSVVTCEIPRTLARPL